LLEEILYKNQIITGEDGRRLRKSTFSDFHLQWTTGDSTILNFISKEICGVPPTGLAKQLTAILFCTESARN
jgi:hypothetical protein